MHKIDNALTQAVQDWLNTPESERDIHKGAEMLLALTHNRALYNSVLRRPDKFMAKMVYELRKHLRLRLDHMAVTDVVRLEAQVIPRVIDAFGEPPAISADSELPEALVAKGKRADHDSLPEDIKDIWETNGQLYRRIVVLFNELKAMADAQPCDRYEKLKMLDEAEKSYRSNFAIYDAYVAPASSEPGVPEPEASSVGEPDSDTPVPDESNATPAMEDESAMTEDTAKAVRAARKTISKYKKIAAPLDPDDPKRVTAVEKIQAAVDVILTAGADFTDSYKSELLALGISLTDILRNAQGVYTL